MKNYYELLEISRDAAADEVKKSFRAQIAKYHPDKVQHLGKEFQAMAADRAAELTEAYRILSDAGRRAAYDATLTQGAPPVTTSPPVSAPVAPPYERPRPIVEEPEPPSQQRPSQFDLERARKDTFVRKATMDRFRTVFTQVAASGYEETSARGFDFASAPRAKLFGRGKGPAMLGRFVPRVDAAAVSSAWADAVRWNAPSGDEICVILMSTALATPRELADAIQDQRRKPVRSSVKVTLIPVDSSVWDAHMPTDAPPFAKDLLTRLRSGK